MISSRKRENSSSERFTRLSASNFFLNTNSSPKTRYNYQVAPHGLTKSRYFGEALARAALPIKKEDTRVWVSSPIFRLFVLILEQAEGNGKTGHNNGNH